MRFAVSAVAAVMAMASSVVAQTADFDPVTKPAKWEVVPAGQTYTVTWTAPAKYADVDVEISLIGGKTQDTQVPISTLATGIKNSAGSYSWSVDSSLGKDAVYGLVVKEVSDPSVFQYSNPFKISASGSSSASASASSASATGAQTVTTAVGVKTVTLSCTTTSMTSTTFSTKLSTATTAAANTTAVWTPPASKTPAPTTPMPLPPTTAPPVPVSTPTTAGASSISVSSFAIVGAAVMAYFAL